MARSVKVILLILTSLAFARPHTAAAADKKDVSELIKLIREASTDKEKPSFFLSYMGFDYSTYIGLKDGKPEFVEVIAKTYYGTKDDFKTYILRDDDLDGVVDSAIFQQGDIIKGKFDRHQETGKDIRSDAQSLYGSAIRFSLRKLNKK